MSGQLVEHRDGGRNAMAAMIERAAFDPGFDVAKFETLVRLADEREEKWARHEFNAAMSAAQSEMLPVIRDAVNTHTKSRYAKLDAIDAPMRPIYTRHGFSVRYGSAPCPREGWLRITATVAHTGGYSEEHYLDAPPDVEGAKGNTNKTAVQGIGSIVTYLRRYLLTMIFNIVLADEDDDDGEASRPEPSHRDNEFLASLQRKLATAATVAQVRMVEDAPSVREALANAPITIRRSVVDLIAATYRRLGEPETPPAGQAEPPPPATTEPQGEAHQAAVDADERRVLEMIAEVDAMNLGQLERLPTDAVWRGRLRQLFPPDEDRVNDALALRKAHLKEGRT